MVCILRSADAVEWATQQVAQGRDPPHLRQLASTTGAENTFEVEELFDRTARELGLAIPSPDEAISTKRTSLRETISISGSAASICCTSFATCI